MLVFALTGNMRKFWASGSQASPPSYQEKTPRPPVQAGNVYSVAKTSYNGEPYNVKISVR